MVVASLRHGIANLIRFEGRDPPRLFWPYAVTLFMGATLAWTAVFMPEFGATMQRAQRFAVDHPDQVTVTQGPGQYSIHIAGDAPGIMPDFRYLTGAVTVIAAIVVLLGAAAVVRRLHDADRRGWWVVPPVVLLAVGLGGFLTMREAAGEAGMPGLGSFAVLFAVNVAYLASVATLFVQLIRSGTPGANRFGPPRPE